MNDIVTLKKALNLITVGLYEKEWKKEEGKYYYSQKLMHGINIFQSLNHKYNPDGFDFSMAHEQGFIQNYAVRPVAEWFEGWNQLESLNLEEQGFYYLGPLVGDSGFHTYHVTDDCEDYVQTVEKDILGGVEQRAVYEQLSNLNQESYVMLRKFFIEHPIITIEELRALKMKFPNNNFAKESIHNAYEEIVEDCYVCPKCGWTLMVERLGMRCQSHSCVEEKYLLKELKEILRTDGLMRLRRGVMKYIAAPGTLELDIYNYCMKYKLECELWPQMDTYDIAITLPDNEIWAIDAKAVREPYFLRENIINAGGFPSGDYDKGFYVIPDQYVSDKPDYLDIINRQLNKMGNDKIQCVKFRDLKRQVRGVVEWK